MAGTVGVTVCASFCYTSKSRIEGVMIRPNAVAVGSRSSVVVRAEAAQTINPEIRKNEEKVVDSVVVAELSKPLTAYCRCWRSGTFPLCDGSHVKHNKATGDNVGPLLLKKQKEYWGSWPISFSLLLMGKFLFGPALHWMNGSKALHTPILSLITGLCPYTFKLLFHTLVPADDRRLVPL